MKLPYPTLTDLTLYLLPYVTNLTFIALNFTLSSPAIIMLPTLPQCYFTLPCYTITYFVLLSHN